MSNRPTTAQMPKSEAVVAIDENPFMMTANGHTGPRINDNSALLHTQQRRGMIFS
jgi:hypothetical protein